MPSERPEFKFDNPFKVDVDLSGFRSKKKSEDEKEKKKGKEKKKPKDAAEAESAKAVADDEADDGANEMKPIIEASRIKDADLISLKSPPEWLPMPKIVLAAFIINMIMILVAIVVSGLVLGGSITVKANAIGLTQSLVLFSAVFGLVYVGFHCVAARKALGIGLFRRRYRRPLHTTIVQLGRITVALWLVSMLAVGITIAKEPASEAGSLSVLKTNLACCLINVIDMLAVVFVVECTRMPFVLPWISPPVPEGEALSLHAKALIDDILGDGVAGHTHANVDSSEAATDGPEPVDTPVVPPATVEAEAVAAAAAAPPGTTPAAFMIQAPMPPPPHIYPAYTPYNPYTAYHPYTSYTPAHMPLPPPAVAPAPAPAPASAPVPAPDPAPGPASAPPPLAMATPRTATIGQSSVRPTPSVTFAIPPQTPTRSSYAMQPIRTPTSAPSEPARHSTPAYSMTGLSGYNPSMYDAASAMRSEVWSRADEGSYTTAPAGMRTPAHKSTLNLSHNPTPYSSSSDNSNSGVGLEQRPPLPPFAPLPLSSYVSPMQSSPPSSMYGPRPVPSQSGYSGRSGGSRRGRGRGGGDERGYYEPVSGRSDGPRNMPAPAGPRVNGKRLFNKAAEGLKAKGNGPGQESTAWEDWGNYKIPGSWW
ncbi:hypothetical protein F503_01574 [Ophiostoma piceae UAMH 11346]|uniref:Uncharacterized protein n=1 Tax=Ophiostoma piceae (strain UAMH 11346) TaxID=1262450 RepID=S3C9F4_OPHP1|nr:hypothetical protein F503_01574 [Ophiostoma piceae UAMH 11346]